MSAISSINQYTPAIQEFEKSANRATSKGFSERINEVLDNINDLQLDAGNMAEKFAKGEIENVHDVIIASEKATVGLDLVLEVRNKLVEAYREVMRMQL